MTAWSQRKRSAIEPPVCLHHNDILDFSRSKPARRNLERIDMELRDTVTKFAQLLAIQNHAKGIELITMLTRACPTGDRRSRAAYVKCAQTSRRNRDQVHAATVRCRSNGDSLQRWISTARPSEVRDTDRNPAERLESLSSRSRRSTTSTSDNRR